MTKLELLKDAVVIDSLGRGEMQRTLLDATYRLQTPACIAVYGPWGTGKSTLLSCTERWLRSHGRPTVFVDPWVHERHGDVLSALLFEIVQQVRTLQVFDDPSTATFLVELARAVARVGLRIGANHLGLSKDDLEDLKELDISKALKAWQDYHSCSTRIQNDFATLVNQLAPKTQGGRLVVFVDDLDRCLPDNVIAILETMKLLLCGSPTVNTVFICALDRHVVGDAIAQRYSTSSRYSGETYLEKLFDLSLEMSPIEAGAVESLISAQWPNADREIADAHFGPVGHLKGIAAALAKPVFANPRVVKRVLNRLVLLLDNEDVVRELKLWSTSECNRFLAWVAGAERFRAFRTAFMEATPGELEALSERQSGARDADTRRLGPALARISEVPGFNQYIEALALQGQLAERLREQQQPRASGSEATLYDFDMLMRKRGL